MKVVIPGGSGFLGSNLAGRLRERGDEVVVLTRGRRRTDDRGVRHVHWDGATMGDWFAELDGADAVVHLSGKRVDCRATKANLAELISSRVDPVVLVGRACEAVAQPPKVWVQSSTLAIHGEGGDAVIEDDTIPTGQGPATMVQVALAWERAFLEAVIRPGAVERTVLLRIGVGVGGEEDPATKRLSQLVRLGLGGKVGDGQHWMSWIGLDDLLDVLLRAIDEPSMHGTYNATAPTPVRNVEMMATYRRVLGRSFGMPSPAWLTRIGAPLLGSDPALALTGRRAVPTRLLAEGFAFAQADFETAVRAAVAA